MIFDDCPSMKKTVDNEDLNIAPDHVLVLRNAPAAVFTAAFEPVKQQIQSMHRAA
jgi:hypothetical protein